MSNGLSEANNMKCPFCQKLMGSSEYEIALKRQEEHVAKKYKDQLDAQNEKYEKEMESLKEMLEKNYDKLLKQNEKENENRFEKWRKSFEKSKENDIKTQTRRIESLLKLQYQNQVKQKDTRIKDLTISNRTLEKNIKERVSKEYEDLLKKRDMQIAQNDEIIKRLNFRIDELQKVATEMPSELQGKIGVNQLMENLRTAFRYDRIEFLGRPGKTEGDIIHIIKDERGREIIPPIIYDNKLASTVTASDVRKAKNYKNVHNTRHVIIVASNLPKKIGNSNIGEKDGILILKSDVAVEVVKQIRQGIIELSRETLSKKDRQLKESLLYDFIKGQIFNENLENLRRLHQQFLDLQSKEMQGHKDLWKRRIELYDALREAHADMASSINSILQNEPPLLIENPFPKKKKKLIVGESSNF